VFPTPIAGPVSSSTSQEIDFLFTARARVGVILADRLLVYGTGGLVTIEVSKSARTAQASA
jgi:opacity protein-like surface antigen